MLKIIADDKIPFLHGILEPFANVVYMPGAQIDSRACCNADALLVRTRTQCNKALLDGSSVKFIATATIGFDHIDTGYCNSHNIRWLNAPGCNASSVAQYVLSALLNLAVEQKFELREKTLGIVGVGHVGSKVAHIGQILGMKILLCDPPRAEKEGQTGFCTLDELLKQSDIISLHVPLNRNEKHKTFHLADTDFFERLKPGCIFINSSRGEVTSTRALKSAIQKGIVSSAVIDVWENEPDIDIKLLQSAHYTTPHIAGYSTDGKAKATSMIVQALSQYFNLPLKHWFPDAIPTPENPLISFDIHEKSTQQALCNVINATYNIKYDSAALKKKPTDFEKFRSNYHLRREFNAYQIQQPVKETPEVFKILNELGFSVIP